MSRKLLNYPGLYGEQEQPSWETAVYIEPLKKRSEVYNYEINEHLHTDLIQVFILEEGAGLLFSEGRNITQTTPCATIIPSGVLHGFVWQPNVMGQVVTIEVPFFEQCLSDAQHLQVQFRELHHLSFSGNPAAFREILFLTGRLHREITGGEVEKRTAVQLYLKLLMVELFRQSVREQTRAIPTDNRKLTYFNAFQKEISRHVDRSKSIGEYAQTLNITPVHLNRVCRALVKKSALQIVHEKLIAEAKKYLLHSNDTIAEIAYTLHFKDPSHFSKFFKKMVGIGPRKFRQSKACTKTLPEK